MPAQFNPHQRGGQPGHQGGQRQKRQRQQPTTVKCDFWEKDNYDLASILANQAEEIARNAKDVSRNQLRNFYGEVKTLERRLEVTQNWKEIYPLVKLIKAKVKYASAKASSVTQVPDEFVQFIENSVNKINSKERFKDFCLIFEAVVGYIYGFGGAR